MTDDQAFAGIVMVGLFALFAIIAQSEGRTPAGTWLIAWIPSCIPVAWWLA